MNNFKRIKQLRIENNFSQKRIAEILSISQQHYSLYETGKYEIPINKIIELAKLYNVSVDYIIELSDDRRKYWNNKSNDVEEKIG